MDDLRINQALEAALLHLKQSHELALTDGGRYQGLYRLMAHPSPQIRAMVSDPHLNTLPLLLLTAASIAMDIAAAQIVKLNLDL